TRAAGAELFGRSCDRLAPTVAAESASGLSGGFQRVPLFGSGCGTRNGRPDLSSAVKVTPSSSLGSQECRTPHRRLRPRPPPSPSRRRGPSSTGGGGGAGGSGGLDEGAAPPADAATVDASDEMRRLLASGGGKQRRGCHLRPIVWKAMLWIGINCLIFGALASPSPSSCRTSRSSLSCPESRASRTNQEWNRSANVLKYVALGVFSVGAVVTAVGLILPSLVWRLFDEDEQLNSATDRRRRGEGAKRSGGFGGCCSDRRWPGCRARPSPPGWRRPPLLPLQQVEEKPGAAAEEPRGGSRWPATDEIWEVAETDEDLGGWPATDEDLGGWPHDEDLGGCRTDEDLELAVALQRDNSGRLAATDTRTGQQLTALRLAQ
uniref:Transmembrane protein n=1 Tax=Macrostomum lignano TaxID=282301 RepID=A0A1I8FPZ3_9PLAT